MTSAPQPGNNNQPIPLGAVLCFNVCLIPPLHKQSNPNRPTDLRLDKRPILAPISCIHRAVPHRGINPSMHPFHIIQPSMIHANKHQSSNPRKSPTSLQVSNISRVVVILALNRHRPAILYIYSTVPVSTCGPSPQRDRNSPHSEQRPVSSVYPLHPHCQNERPVKHRISLLHSNPPPVPRTTSPFPPESRNFPAMHPTVCPTRLIFSTHKPSLRSMP